jgi:hypothetical protein
MPSFYLFILFLISTVNAAFCELPPVVKAEIYRELIRKGEK